MEQSIVLHKVLASTFKDVFKELVLAGAAGELIMRAALDAVDESNVKAVDGTMDDEVNRIDDSTPHFKNEATHNRDFYWYRGVGLSEMGEKLHHVTTIWWSKGAS